MTYVAAGNQGRGCSCLTEENSDRSGNMARSLLSRAVDVVHLSRLTLLPGTRLYTQTQTEPLTVKQENNRIRRIILNNPKKRNALSLAMLESLRENILTDIDSENLRVIIISAKGPVFSSGHDLKELTSAQGREYHTQVFHTCAEVMTLIQDIPVPVIAMVNGIATAAGCQLVASCDIAVVTEKSTFATPGVNVGLFCSTPAVAIGRAVPRKVAMEMLFTGAPISAHDALLHGLVSKVVPEERLEEETLAIAQRVCQASRPVVALGKATFQRQMAQGRDAAYATASKVMVDNLALRDGQEGIRAFIEKRKPVWSHTAETAHD
uniref:Enoyl-CoA hydratase domain-containing protein 3, mitochondrial n=2 Tax=Myripristis murdjan TaxID=586833 RepID=A0A667YW08_9TELE